MCDYTPGIYDISNEEYHAADGVSRSGILELKKSGLHYISKYKHPVEEEKEHFIFGSAVHCYILEPDDFVKRYFVCDKPKLNSNAGKEKMKEIMEEANGRTMLATEVFNQIEAMGNSFLKHPIASKFLAQAKVEKSIFWKDPKTNVLLKARPDIWLPHLTADIKTTRDASYHAVQREIASSGYHIQAAMIHDAIYAVTGKKLDTHIILAIEKSFPYDIAIYSLDTDSIETGKKEYKKYVEVYKNASEKQEWRGYVPQSISLPAYYN